MTTQTQTYDLDAIASAVGIKPERARLIISNLVENFGFNAETVPANSLVNIIGSIVGLQQTHNLSVQGAVAKYYQSLQEQHKKEGNGKTGYAAGSMAETIDNMADQLADQLAPRVVELTAKKLESKVVEELTKGFKFIQIEDCFKQLDLIIDAEIREVEKSDRFQLNGQESALSYFALPEGK